MKFWSKFHTEIWDSVLVEFSFATYDLRRVTKRPAEPAQAPSLKRCNILPKFYSKVGVNYYVKIWMRLQFSKIPSASNQVRNSRLWSGSELFWPNLSGILSKVRIFQKIAKITHEIGFFWHLLNESANVIFKMKVLESLDFSTESGFLKTIVRIWSGFLKKIGPN